MRRILIFTLLLIPIWLLSQNANVWQYKIGSPGEIRAGFSGGWFTWQTSGADSVISASFSPQSGYAYPWNGILSFESYIDTTVGTRAYVTSQGSLYVFVEQMRAGQWWKVDTLDWSVYQNLDAQGDSTVEVFNAETQETNLLLYQTDPTSTSTRELETYPQSSQRIKMMSTDSVYFRQYLIWKAY